MIVRHKIISILTNQIQCMLVVTTTIMVVTSTDSQWRPSELVPLGLRAISAIVKTATLSSLH